MNNNQPCPPGNRKILKDKIHVQLRAAKNWVVYLMDTNPDHSEDHPLFNVYKLEGENYEKLVRFYKDQKQSRKARIIE